MDTINTNSLFAAYPHLATKIKTQWGTAAGRARLVELLSDTRDGNRAGFDPAHAKTIFALLARHDVLFPQFDTTHDIIPPFQVSIEGRPAPVKDDSGVNLFKLAGWIVVIVLSIGIYFKHLH